MKAPQVLSGFQDLLPQDMAPRNKVLNEFKAAFERHGFEPVETPSLEYYSTLTGKEGGETEMLMYDFTDRGDRHIGLIYDLTVPIARVMATYQDIPKPFKRYQIQRVWRAERPQKGRYREFCQCDVDVFGTASPLSDALIITVLSECIEKIGFERFHVVVNHRQVLEGIIRAACVPKELTKEAIIAIDKLDKIGQEGVKNELEKLGVSNPTAITSAISLEGGQDVVLSELAEMLRGDEDAVAAIANIKEVTQIAIDMGAKVKFDPSLARGQSYYTGPVFECRLDDVKFGSLGGGGRYDNLIGIFSGQQISATGASLGIDRIMAAIKEVGLPGQAQATAQVAVLHFGEGARELAIKASSALMAKGVNVDLFVGDSDLRKQLKYASKKGVSRVVIVGEDEAKSGKVTIKDMATGDQTIATLDEMLQLF